MNDEKAIGIAAGVFFTDAIYLVDYAGYRRGLIGIAASDTIIWFMVAAEAVLAFGLLFRQRGFCTVSCVWSALRFFLHGWQFVRLVQLDLARLETGVERLFYISSASLLLLFGFVTFAL